MVINLIQINLQKTYEAGKEVMVSVSERMATESSPKVRSLTTTPERRRGHGHRYTLGIFQSITNLDSACTSPRTFNRYAQTNLSFPLFKQLMVTSDGVTWVTGVPDGKSPDEVTTLVESNIEVAVLAEVGENYDEIHELKRMGTGSSATTPETAAAPLVLNGNIAL